MSRIAFFADNHYGCHPGRHWLESLPEHWQKLIFFAEDDWQCLEDGSALQDCRLLMLNMVGGSCGVQHPQAGAEGCLLKYLQAGGNMLLLHGSSAAFWQWSWWRRIVGLRWVRENDPDGAEVSTHPVQPYHLKLCKVRHPLTANLQEFELPSDEIYTHLEQVAPIMTLMECTVENRTWPQCWENFSPWGGRVIGFLPGHALDAIKQPGMIHNITCLIDWLYCHHTG